MNFCFHFSLFSPSGLARSFVLLFFVLLRLFFSLFFFVQKKYLVTPSWCLFINWKKDICFKMTTVFELEYYCTKNDQPPCRLVDLEMDREDCSLPKIGGIASPSLIVVCAISGVTAVLSAMKIWKNRDARGRMEWFISFVFLSCAMFNAIIMHCLAYNNGSAASDFFATLQCLFAIGFSFSFLFTGFVDFGVLKEKSKYCYMFYGGAYFLIFIILLVEDGKDNAGALFMLYYVMPMFAYILAFSVETIHVARRRHYKALWYLCCATGLFIFALIVEWELQKPFCKALTGSFDGSFFFFAMLDGVISLLYKYFVLLKEDELDDDDIVTPLVCCYPIEEWEGRL